jgi:DNA-binding MurR/RpiR family transcriptional regulator
VTHGIAITTACCCPPSDVRQLKNLIASDLISFPRRLESVLRFALEHPEEVAFGTTVSVAKRCAVSHSTVVRLATTLGFDEFWQFRECFRAEVRRKAVQ